MFRQTVRGLVSLTDLTKMHVDGATSKKILQLWLEGLSFSQISAEVGVASKDVSRIVYDLRVSGMIAGRERKVRGVTLFGLRYNSCRYIIEEKENVGSLYCGEPTFKVSYCKEHYALCYMPPKN